MHVHAAVAALIGSILISAPTAADQRQDAEHTASHLDGRYGHNHHYADRGIVVDSLPPDAMAVRYGRDHYWFNAGVWYRAQGTQFIVTAPPIGAIVPVLPPFYTALMIGGIPYYYANDTHYVWRNGDHGYQVVEPPPGADATQVVTPATAAAGARPTGPDSVFIYPDKGQSAEQQEKDRSECHRWAVDQAGFDPTRSPGEPSAEQSASRTANYFRAMNACVNARGYTVR